jgi:hypothetical protein
MITKRPRSAKAMVGKGAVGFAQGLLGRGQACHLQFGFEQE